MGRVLVTGGTGTLGGELMPRLVKGGHTVRMMSRRTGESSAAGPVEWAQADINKVLLGDILLPIMVRGPLMFLPGSLKFQLIDAGEVAEHMAATLANGPSGRLPEIGGPEVQTLRQMAPDWLRACGKDPPVVPVPALGPLSGVAKGYNCCPENKFGKITWREWLAKRYPVHVGHSTCEFDDYVGK